MVDQQVQNVVEAQLLYDTVLVSPFLTAANVQFRDGWFLTFAAIGAANDIPFFNVRNRNHGLPYNNQDTRDQSAFPMQIYSMGISFFAPQIASQFIDVEGTPSFVEEIHSAVWQADLPRHASITLRINQDERFKGQCAMIPSGMGPFGGGEAHGNPAHDNIVYGGNVHPSIMKGAATMGYPEITNRWPFPVPIDVPRRATISAVIKFSEYGRALLAQMTGPHDLGFATPQAGLDGFHSMFGIQVSLTVRRQVQQRGQYHV